MSSAVLEATRWLGVEACMASACVLATSGHEYLASAAVLVSALCIPGDKRGKDIE